MRTSQYRIGQVIKVNDYMQKNYSYTLQGEIGRKAADFNQGGFDPFLDPAEMLKRGVFEGRYLNDCTGEFPEE